MFRSFDRPQINNLGRVAFSAQQIGPGIGPPQDNITERGVWSEGFGNGLRLVVRADDPAPGTEGRLFGRLFLQDFNDAGHVVIDGRLRPSNADRGLWIFRSSAQLELITLEGNAVPWINGAIFSETGLLGPNLNEAGRVIFEQSYRDEPVTFRGGGVIEWSDGVLRPLGVGEAVDVGLPGVHTINVDKRAAGEGGHISFLAFLEGTEVTSGNNAALFVRDINGSIRLVAREGDAPPGIDDGHFFETFWLEISAPSVLGLATVYAHLDGTLTRSGIWSERGGDGLELLVKTGDPLPGESGITLNPGQMRANDSGRVAFAGGLFGASVTPDSNEALFSDGLSGDFNIVARLGSAVPGVENAVFEQFVIAGGDEFHLNNFGQLMFWAAVRGAGISATNDEGLWAQNRQGLVKLIVREGMTIDVDDGIGVDLRTVSAVDRRGENRFNDLGQVVFAVSFTDGTSGVFVSNAAAVPEPTSRALALVIGFVIVSLQRHKSR